MSFAVFFLVGIFKPMGIEIIANNNNNKKSHSSHMELEQKNKSNETFINI